MTTVIQQKGLPKDYFLHIKGDSLVSQKWGETPSDPTTLPLGVDWGSSGSALRQAKPSNPPKLGGRQEETCQAKELRLGNAKPALDRSLTLPEFQIDLAHIAFGTHTHQTNMEQLIPVHDFTLSSKPPNKGDTVVENAQLLFYRSGSPISMTHSITSNRRQSKQKLIQPTSRCPQP